MRAAYAFLAAVSHSSPSVLIALSDADPPPWLSWSTGSIRTRGFTRGRPPRGLVWHWAPGNFHDRLLSPLLSLLQQGVFALFGVGSWPVCCRPCSACSTWLSFGLACGACGARKWLTGGRRPSDRPRRLGVSTTVWPCRRRRRSSGLPVVYALGLRAHGRSTANGFVELGRGCLRPGRDLQAAGVSHDACVCRWVGEPLRLAEARHLPLRERIPAYGG